MGSAQEGVAPSAKASSRTTTAKPQELADSSPPPTNPAAYSTDWSTVRAYYSSAAAAATRGTPPPFYAPPVWGSQSFLSSGSRLQILRLSNYMDAISLPSPGGEVLKMMVSPYGTPIPYSPMYPVYAHPSVATTAGYPIAEPGSNKLKIGEGGSGKPEDGSKVTSESADDYGSQSGGESGSVGSSDTREDGNESQDAARKRSFGDAFIEGEFPQPIIAARNNSTNSETPYRGRQRTVSKLPVSAPGRATLAGPASNLNTGMEVWSSPHVGIAPKVKPNSANLASAPVGANGVANGHPWMRDEREVKRERRKQSNRESARRSRMRKQQECEDLARKVTELISKNSTLKVELEQLNRACKDLEAENASITEDLNSRTKTGSQFPFTTQARNSE